MEWKEWTGPNKCIYRFIQSCNKRTSQAQAVEDYNIFLCRSPMHDHISSESRNFHDLNIYIRAKENKKPVGFELSSNMHMYYAIDSHIYSFSFMTTYVFLV